LPKLYDRRSFVCSALCIIGNILAANRMVDTMPAKIGSVVVTVDFSVYFDFPAEIRRLIYTTNTVEGYHRQVRKVLKNKGSLPTPEAVRKLLFLANRDITKKWTMPVANWAKIRSQLAIRFEERFPL
jgi:transposase-like protein